MDKAKPTARRTRIEPGIYTRPDGLYEIGFRDSTGRQRWRKIDGGIRAARAALAQEHARRARGEKIAADPRLKFDGAADQWWEARARKLRPATQNAYKYALAHLRKPENFERMRLADITTTDIAKFVTRQQEAGLKGWTIKGQLSVLSAIFRYAGRHLGHVGGNPVGLLDRIERPSTEDESPKRILTDDELRRLLDALSDRYRLIFEVMAETGLRLGEVLGLVWSEIDLTGATISVTHQLDRNGLRQPLKTAKSRRSIEITPVLAAKLKAHKSTGGTLAGHALVFRNRNGQAHDHRNIGGRVLARAVDRAGLGAVADANGRLVNPAPTSHDLRHTHASRLIAAGWDIQEISARLGHSNIATTQRTYVHEFDAAGRSDDRRKRLAALYAAG